MINEEKQKALDEIKQLSKEIENIENNKNLSLKTLNEFKNRITNIELKIIDIIKEWDCNKEKSSIGWHIQLYPG